MSRADDLAARCEFENQLYLSGDPRGIYGLEYTAPQPVEVMPVVTEAAMDGITESLGPVCYRCKARGVVVAATKSWGEGAEVCDVCNDHLETLRVV